MAIKVALLVITALIAVAAAYPRATVTSEFDCNEDTSYEVVVSWTNCVITVHAQLFLASGLCVYKCVCIVIHFGSVLSV